MKNILLIAAVALSSFTQAQPIVYDSVSMNTGYQDEIYYNLYSGTKTPVPFKNWDLAFCTNAMEVGIRINDVNGVNLWAVPGTDTLGWATVDSAGYQSWQEVHNTDTAMYYGAFNVNANGGTFDFSWGVYDVNTHEVTGDSLFLIKVTDLQGNEFFKKLWIIKRANNSMHDWIFRYANLDNTGDVTVTIPTTTYDTKNFIYYSIINGTTVDREPASADWDFVFTRYTTDLGGGFYYPVTGVFSNFGVEVADVRPVDVATTNSDAPFLSLYSNHLNEIGHDWKTFNMTTSMWEVEDSLVYFVKTNAGEVYKVVFTGFDGSLTGNIYFNKTLVSTTGIADAGNHTGLAVYPNPAKDVARVSINRAGTTEAGTYALFSMSGAEMISGIIPSGSRQELVLNTSTLKGGVYLLEARLGAETFHRKIVIQ